MAGRKFRRRGRPLADLGNEFARPPLWSRRLLPIRASSRSRPAASIRSCLWMAKVRTRNTAPNPPGEYAQSCVGRERMFEYFSTKHSTPGRLFRLNYAIDNALRRAARHRQQGAAGQTDRTSASATSISSGQGDASAQALRCLAHCETSTSPINVSGHENPGRARTSPRNSASDLARAPVITGKEEPTAWLTDTSQAVNTVRPTDCRYRAAHQLDRRLGIAIDAEPRQAHQIRGARWPLLSRSTSSSSALRCAGRACALHRGGLETRTEADWRFFLSKGVVFGVRDGARLVADRGTAALLGRQCLDQHGAGDRGLSPPRHCDQARRCLPQCNEAAQPDDLAGRDNRLAPTVYGPLGFMPTLQLRRLRWQSPRKPMRHGSFQPATSRPWSCAMPSAMGFDRSTLLSEFAARSGSRVASGVPAMARRPRWTHRTSYRSAAGRSHRSGARAGGCHRPLRDRALADRRRPRAGRVSERACSVRLEHRAAVSAHALWPCDRSAPAQTPFAVAGPEFG